MSCLTGVSKRVLHVDSLPFPTEDKRGLRETTYLESFSGTPRGRNWLLPSPGFKPSVLSTIAC